ncbi:hypothetical protein KUTeg_017777 [Tegillarca granosa]|uniref:Uncharacterized protein n=1 Tax=Tegillarca granosa TaxID=220873 RepID=A0ABQ9EFW5_TEGGR|nr:hypothetical protein KUTeg_017777 [Tegillarca granosa]
MHRKNLRLTIISEKCLRICVDVEIFVTGILVSSGAVGSGTVGTVVVIVVVAWCGSFLSNVVKSRVSCSYSPKIWSIKFIVSSPFSNVMSGRVGMGSLEVCSATIKSSDNLKLSNSKLNLAFPNSFNGSPPGPDSFTVEVNLEQHSSDIRLYTLSEITDFVAPVSAVKIIFSPSTDPSMYTPSSFGFLLRTIEVSLGSLSIILEITRNVLQRIQDNQPIQAIGGPVNNNADGNLANINRSRPLKITDIQQETDAMLIFVSNDIFHYRIQQALQRFTLVRKLGHKKAIVQFVGTISTPISILSTDNVAIKINVKRRYFGKDIYDQPLSHIDLHCYENRVMSNIAMDNNRSFNIIDNGEKNITENTGDDYTKLQLANNGIKKEAGTYTGLQMSTVNEKEGYTDFKFPIFFNTSKMKSSGKQDITRKTKKIYEDVSTLP